MEHFFQEQVAESLATVTDLVIIFSAILCKIIPSGFLSQNFLPKVHSTLSFHSNCECLTTLSSNCLHLDIIFPALSSSSRVTYPYGYLPSLETTILWYMVVVLVVRVLAIVCPCVLVTSSVKVDVVSCAFFQNSAVLGFPNEGQERPVRLRVPQSLLTEHVSVLSALGTGLLKPGDTVCHTNVLAYTKYDRGSCYGIK